MDGAVAPAVQADFGHEQRAIAREVLRDYGNMSAATVLFVLERTLAKADSGPYLMSALGPGFSVGFQLLEAA